MGNIKNQLSWTWPLISPYWISETLSFLASLDDPSWMGLQRQLTALVPNRPFGARIFLQMKAFLKESEIVSEDGKYLRISIGTNNEDIIKHLKSFYGSSNCDWVELFRIVVSSTEEVSYTQLKNHPPNIFPEISDYSTFKQWATFFQYIGYGFLITNDLFIPISAVSRRLYMDPIFIQKCLKAGSDPRCLTGHESMHPEADSLYWTRGEDNLPIHSDTTIVPRIPLDKIIDAMDKGFNKQVSFSDILHSAATEFRGHIAEELTQYPFKDLENFVFTCKQLLDYFLFGKSVHQSDHITKDQVQSASEIWKSVVHFQMPESFWKMLPNLYRDISRLCWGVSYYRTNLQRAMTFTFNESVFNYDGIQRLRNIPIRCRRSKRTIFSFYNILVPIRNALIRLTDNNVTQSYQHEAEKILQFMTKYIPDNTLDRVDVIEDLSLLINVSVDIKEELFKVPKLGGSADQPDHTLLRACYWVHKYIALKSHSSVLNLMAIKSKLDDLEGNLTAEVNRYNQPYERLNVAVKNLQERTFTIRSNLR